MGQTHPPHPRPHHSARPHPRPIPLRPRRTHHGSRRLRPRTRIRNEQPGEARGHQRHALELPRAPDFGLRRSVLLRDATFPELSDEAHRAAARGDHHADEAEHRSRPRCRDADASRLSDFGGAEGRDHVAVRVRQPAPVGGAGETPGDALSRLALEFLAVVDGGAEGVLFERVLSRREHGSVSQFDHGGFDAQLFVGLLEGDTEGEGGVRSRWTEVFDHDEGSD
mmetsp:Transcript_31616/g.66230  ORF Transcript_31616/g.66230 Transcript_31616/m.66230 type:complete len:224 (-) Transcript_31616:544-1215(-)